MALPILSELNQELTRLFVAGSRLCNGDPRLKKFVEPLNRFGEKAPVFSKLAKLLEELLDAEPTESARKLLETEAFLQSILATQGETVAGDANAISNEEETTPDALIIEQKLMASINEIKSSAQLTGNNPLTTVPYRSLAPVLTALRKSGGGRMQVLESGLEHDIFLDPRLVKPTADALADSSIDVTEFLIKKAIPIIGQPIIPYLLDAYNPGGSAVDGRRLRALYRIMGEAAVALVEDSFDKGSTPVKIVAAHILADYPRSETLLIGGLTGKKEVRESTMDALIRMDSHTGIDKIIALIDKPEAFQAITRGNSPYLVEWVLSIAHERGEAFKQDVRSTDNLSLYIVALELLRHKPSKPVAEFLQSLLADGWLDNINDLLTEPHVDSLKNPLSNSGKKIIDTALEILYYTGYGYDFIWEMFKNTQQSLLGKMFGRKKEYPATLPVYAFTIGASRLDAEAFYDAFFKTDLYQGIAKLNRVAFSEVFFTNNAPPYSSRIAGYFLKCENYNLAIRTAFANDKSTLNALADLLQNNLEKNVYGHDSDLILQRLGQVGHKQFAPLYKLYCEKKRGSETFREELRQYLQP